MGYSEIMCWAAIHHYPQVLHQGRILIGAGLEGWYRFLKQHTAEDLDRVEQRIARWKLVEKGAA